MIVVLFDRAAVAGSGRAIEHSPARCNTRGNAVAVPGRCLGASRALRRRRAGVVVVGPDHPPSRAMAAGARLISAPDTRAANDLLTRRNDGQTAPRRTMGKRANPRLVAQVPAGRDL